MSDTETLIEHLREWKDIYKGQPVSIALRRAYTALADMQTLLGVRDRELAEARENLRAANKGAERNMKALNLAITDCDMIKQQRDRLAEALGDLHSAAKGLAHGTDWNHGTHAIMHGYRARLLAAIPAAAEALAAVKGGQDAMGS